MDHVLPLSLNRLNRFLLRNRFEIHMFKEIHRIHDGFDAIRHQEFLQVWICSNWIIEDSFNVNLSNMAVRIGTLHKELWIKTQFMPQTLTHTGNRTIMIR